MERGLSVAEGDKDRFDRVGGMSDILSKLLNGVDKESSMNRVD